MNTTMINYLSTLAANGDKKAQEILYQHNNKEVSGKSSYVPLTCSGTSSYVPLTCSRKLSHQQEQSSSQSKVPIASHHQPVYVPTTYPCSYATSSYPCSNATSSLSGVVSKNVSDAGSEDSGRSMYPTDKIIYPEQINVKFYPTASKKVTKPRPRTAFSAAKKTNKTEKKATPTFTVVISGFMKKPTKSEITKLVGGKCTRIGISRNYSVYSKSNFIAFCDFKSSKIANKIRLQLSGVAFHAQSPLTSKIVTDKEAGETGADIHRVVINGFTKKPHSDSLCDTLEQLGVSGIRSQDIVITKKGREYLASIPVSSYAIAKKARQTINNADKKRTPKHKGSTLTCKWSKK